MIVLFHKKNNYFNKLKNADLPENLKAKKLIKFIRFFRNCQVFFEVFSSDLYKKINKHYILGVHPKKEPRYGEAFLLLPLPYAFIAAKTDKVREKKWTPVWPAGPALLGRLSTDKRYDNISYVGSPQLRFFFTKGKVSIILGLELAERFLARVPGHGLSCKSPGAGR